MLDEKKLFIYVVNIIWKCNMYDNLKQSTSKKLVNYLK